MVRANFNLLQRVRGILFAPHTEWRRIARESASPAALFARYAIPLALLPAVANFAGQSLIGMQVSVGVFREPIGLGLVKAMIGYLLSFAIVLLLAVAINLLARHFGGRRNFPAALKLAVYSATPAWLSGIFLALPGFQFLTLAGFYGGYLLWTGLPILLDMPARRASVFAGAIVAIAFVSIITFLFAARAILSLIVF